MKAAIYTRRSTEEHQEESLILQEGSAREYIRSTLPKYYSGEPFYVADEHVFQDDAISRAEFKKRPGLLAMIGAANRGDFDAVIMRDESRLGGDMLRTGAIIQDLVDNGIRIFYFFADEEVKFTGAAERFAVAAKNFAAELEREKTSQRTRESLASKAQRGLNAGGRCYGYDNVEVVEGGRRLRVEYAINEEQANVVRNIYQWYANGQGLRAIAIRLNSGSIASPSAGSRGTGSWSPSCIRAMLRRERYRGLIVWGRKGKEYKGGTKVRVVRPESGWIRESAPKLRIVSKELCKAVDDRIQKTRKFTGKAGAAGPRAKYLLSGLAKCGECGGSMQATNAGGATRYKVYVCSWRRNRGAVVCGNKSRRTVADVDKAVIGWIQANVLNASVVDATIREVRRLSENQTASPELEIPALTKKRKALRKEVERMTEALALAGAQPAAVIQAIVKRETKIKEISSQMKALQQPPSAINTRLNTLHSEASKRLKDLAGMMARNPEEARKALEELLTEPLKFSAIEGSKQIRVEGQVNHLALFTTVSDPTEI